MTFPRPTPDRRRSARRPQSTRLGFESLEARENPVLGGGDVPFVSDTDAVLGNTNLTGVVDYRSVDPATGQVVGFCSGALLDVGGGVTGSRYVLTAAHCDPKPGDLVAFNTRLADGSIQQIVIPVIAAWTHPDWTGNVNDLTGDIALAVLASAAPVGTAQYPLFTATASQNEIGKTFFMGGYGLSGTGTVGQVTFTELQRLTVNATAGAFRIVVPPNTLGFAQGQSGPLPYNATPAQVRDALVGLGIGTTANPPLVRRPVIGPFKDNSYEVVLPYQANLPRLRAVSDPAAPLVVGGALGSVGFTTLIDGGVDPEYQRLRVTATGGTFRVGVLGGQTNPLPSNVTAAELQAALEAIPGVGEVTVRKVDAGPAIGSFEIAFNSYPGDLDLISVDASGLTGGTAAANTVIDFGSRVLRAGRNVYDRVQLNALISDFDPDGNDSFEGQGDSGSAGLIDTGGGRMAIASVVSGGGFVFGDPEFNTRVSRYAADVLAQTTAPYAVTVDTQYQIAGNDARPDAFRVTQGGGLVQVFVRPAGEAERLYYSEQVNRVASVVLRGSSDDDTFVIDPSVTIPVSVFGNGRNDTLVTSGRAATVTVTGPDTGTATQVGGPAFAFTGVANVVAGPAADTFTFLPGGSMSGTVDGGGGADTLDLSGLTAAGAVRVTGAGATDGFDLVAGPAGSLGRMRNFDVVSGAKFIAGDALTGPDGGGQWTVTGATGTLAATGRTLAFNFFEALTGGAGADTFDIRATASPVVFAGGAGNDFFDVAPGGAPAGTIGGALTFDGGPGDDYLRAAGSAAAEALTATLTAPGTGTLGGLPYAVTFTGMLLATVDGAGGANSAVVTDATGAAYGTPLTPTEGIIYSPTGADSGVVRVGTAGALGVAGVRAGLTVAGDADAGGFKDLLVVTGTSGPGAQSDFGEAGIADGQDLISVTDGGVQLSSVTAGPLLGVTYGVGADRLPVFDAVYVAGGTERTAAGDVITVTPGNRVNLIVNAQGPTRPSRPGDRLVLTAGGGTAALLNDPGVGPPQVRYTTAGGQTVGLIGFEAGVPAAAGLGMVAAGTDAGPESTVRVFDRVTGALRSTFTPFPGFTGGVSVATGDVTGDGLADLIVGAGPGGGPRVAVFNGLDNTLVYDFFGYESSFRGGVNVSTGDFDADGIADIVLGTGVGGGPRVRVLSGATLAPIKDVLVFNRDFRGGVNVATGDVNGDGTPDLVNSTGTGGGPRVVVLDGRNLASIASFFVFDPNSRTGFYATSGDVNGDGFADIVVGSGAGAAAQVRVFSGLNRQLLADFSVNDPFDPTQVSPITAGVRVSTADINSDGIADVVTSTGPGTAPILRTYQLAGVDPTTNALFTTLQEIRRQVAYEDGFNSGVFVGSGD